jgi:hypothetical protein
MIQKHQTACCALCQLTASNEDSLEALDEAINKIKKSANKLWAPADRSGGERCIFVITTTEEPLLRNNLRTLGFFPRESFPRRNGYKSGLLTMWTLTF